jgi:DnaJ-class molecular chaperone
MGRSAMTKDYYVVLGISRGADLNRIKKAYRKIVKQSHPDVSSSGESSDRFREVREAYETLADENRRRQYDAEQKRIASPPIRNRAPELVRRQSPLFENFDRLTSFADEFFEGFLPGILGPDESDRRHKDIYLEVILSPTEALRGGLFPVKVPIIEPCHRCGKSGYREDFFCPLCGGYGRIKTEREFSLSIPPRVSTGAQVKLSMEDIGLKGVNLFVLVSIDPSLGPELW